MKHLNNFLLSTTRKLALTLMVFAFFSIMGNAQTITDVVVNSPDHTTLEDAVIAAELDDDLSGPGPFTLFAPTDAAFDALPEGTLDALLEDPTGNLAAMLQFHVVSGETLSADLSNGDVLTTLQGQELEVSIEGGDVFINGAQVTTPDVNASNGVVHVVDGVLNPTVTGTITRSADHTTLATAITEAELFPTLTATGEYTVFAPTDAAFDALPDGVLTELLENPTGNLAAILLHHVVSGTKMAADLSDGLEVTTLKGQDVTVSIEGSTVMIDNATVTVTDIEAANGVVHVLDAVLMPSFDVQVTNTAEYGDILTDREGLSLYFFTKDAQSEASSCTDGCLDAWPLFDQGNLYLPEDLNRDDFARFERADGSMQVTFKGWPLYYYQSDENPGDINGEGVINSWYVAKPDYTIMLMDDQLVGEDGLNYTGDYEEGEEIVQYFVDDKGRTLYTWTNDFKNQNNFTAEDFSNNGVWPVYEEDNVVAPSVLNSADFGSIDVYGKQQMTYKGWPLYHYGDDNMERGSNKGVSFPDPGVWPVAVVDMMPALPATVVDIVVESENHTTLETAVIEAELADDLSGEGPFTVFAPTDAAFNALPEGVLDDLLVNPTGELAQILLYHVAGGKVMAGDLSNGQMIETLQGKEVEVTIDNGDVFINDAQVTVVDIEAGNGVVHVIDAVLSIPNTVVDVIVNSEDHNTLETAVIEAELVDDLSADGPFTVFAPTDAAFDALPEGVLDDLLADPTGELAQILLYHVAGGKVMSGDLSDGQMIETLQGEDVEITIDNGDVFINEAQVTVADSEADNGVVHVIDAVLLPAQFTSVASVESGMDKLSVYPNPAKEAIHVDFYADGTGDVIFEIYNISGEIVISKNLGALPTGKHTFNQAVTDLPAGVYILTIGSKGNKNVAKVHLVE